MLQYYDFLDKRVDALPEDLKMVPLRELLDPQCDLKRSLLCSKANWDKVFLDPSKVDSHFKSIMMSQNPLKLAPDRNRGELTGSELSIHSKSINAWDGEKCSPHKQPRNSKNQRQIENRENLIFSKSATKTRKHELIKNPLEAGFNSRSKSPIAAGLSSHQGGSAIKSKQKSGVNGRWK